MIGCPYVFCNRRTNLENMALHSDNPNTIKIARGYIESKCDWNYEQCSRFRDLQRKASVSNLTVLTLEPIF